LTGRLDSGDVGRRGEPELVEIEYLVEIEIALLLRLGTEQLVQLVVQRPLCNLPCQTPGLPPCRPRALRARPRARRASLVAPVTLVALVALVVAYK
jgi:hypothetical protein